jgi:cobalt-precorrin 5A hydrolase
MRVAGFGFRQNASLASFQAALDLTGAVDALATTETKLPGLAELSRVTGLPVISVTKAELMAHARPGTARVMAQFGTGSVAESAAIAAVGPGARLTMSRITSPDGQVVVAIAEGQGP